MGVYIQTKLMYGYIFSKKVFFEHLVSYLNESQEFAGSYDETMKYIEQRRDYGGMEMFLPTSVEYFDSENLYTGEDYLQEVYIVDEKRIYDATDYSPRVIKEFNKTQNDNLEKFIQSLGLYGKENNSGWILRCYQV